MELVESMVTQKNQNCSKANYDKYRSEEELNPN
jgi:hypothetical protein